MYDLLIEHVRQVAVLGMRPSFPGAGLNTALSYVDRPGARGSRLISLVKCASR